MDAKVGPIFAVRVNEALKCYLHETTSDDTIICRTTKIEALQSNKICVVRHKIRVSCKHSINIFFWWGASLHLPLNGIFNQCIMHITGTTLIEVFSSWHKVKCRLSFPNHEQEICTRLATKKSMHFYLVQILNNGAMVNLIWVCFFLGGGGLTELAIEWALLNKI
jgi:hypothetical protein